jgi:hypothetical protein
MSTNPSRRNELSGVVTTFCTQYFIFPGAAKYGSPSTIITIPNTHKKNSITAIHNPFQQSWMTHLS